MFCFAHTCNSMTLRRTVGNSTCDSATDFIRPLLTSKKNYLVFVDKTRKRCQGRYVEKVKRN